MTREVVTDSGRSTVLAAGGSTAYGRAVTMQSGGIDRHGWSSTLDSARVGCDGGELVRVPQSGRRCRDGGTARALVVHVHRGDPGDRWSRGRHGELVRRDAQGPAVVGRLQGDVGPVRPGPGVRPPVAHAGRRRGGRVARGDRATSPAWAPTTSAAASPPPCWPTRRSTRRTRSWTPSDWTTCSIRRKPDVLQFDGNGPTPSWSASTTTSAPPPDCPRRASPATTTGGTTTP